MNFAPIVIFTYNRPIHTKETIDALLQNQYAKDSDLIIFSDAPKNEEVESAVLETRDYLKTLSGFKTVKIIERENNMGLADNIIDGVTSVVNEYGKVIVLEDDLLTSPYFLEFMNRALDKYENDKEVVSVHGYVYPVKKKLPENFFLRHTDSLGWGTWKNEWAYFNRDGNFLLEELYKKRLTKEFNFNNSYNFIKMLKAQVEGKNNSWAIRWYASAFLKNKLSLFPNKSLVFHNGNDYLGTNCDNSDSWLDVELATESVNLLEIPVKENEEVRKIYESFFRSVHKNLLKKIQKRIVHIYGKVRKNH